MHNETDSGITANDHSPKNITAYEKITPSCSPVNGNGRLGERFKDDSQPCYTFDSETGALTLISGKFNCSVKWLDLNVLDVKSVTATSDVSFTDDCQAMFYKFTNCETIDLSNVNTSEMTGAFSMFAFCENLTSLNISGWIMDNVTDIGDMFHKCKLLTFIDISGWNTDNVTDVGGLFLHCESLTSLDLSGWNTANVWNMFSVFSYCTSLTTLDLSGWDTGNAYTMKEMFSHCTNLTSLDLSGWTTDSVRIFNNMFNGSSNLTTIYTDREWSTESLRTSNGMFDGCTALMGGMGTAYDENHTDVEYARIDGGPSAPGYFTAKPDSKPGDVNGDGNVNITDVTTLIAAALNDDLNIIIVANADLNGDGHINITDVTELISMVLNN